MANAAQDYRRTVIVARRRQKLMRRCAALIAGTAPAICLIPTPNDQEVKAS